MMTMSKHEGSCHCGAVRFEVEGPLEGAMTCNCSMCGRAGTLLVFVPGARFELISGEDATRDYQFGKAHIHHLFCTTCGIKPYAWGLDEEGGRTVAVNLRCVQGVEPTEVEAQHFDGRAL